MRGLSDLVDELEAVGRVKPTAAYIEDLGASAAYMVSSVAGRVSANASAYVGSIGTYAVLYDQSALFAKEGIRPIVVRAGDMKGIGIPGTEITAEQVAELQRMVDFTNGFFLSAVTRGRGMSGERLTAVADGRMWGAAEAVELGLIDAVETFDAAFSNLAARAAESKKGVGTMNSPTGQPRTAATLQELRTVCVGADDSFLLSQLGSGATMEEAGRAWITRQAELLTEARAQAAAAASRPGVPPVPSGGRAGGPAQSARQELEALVQTRMQSTGEPRHKAWSTVMARNEDLRQRMVEEENAAAR
jgi:ClpP class serine protease